MSEYFLNNRLKKEKIAGLCYSSFRDGQSPITKIYPTAEQIREDFALIKNCGQIRLYSLHGPNNVAEIAGEYKLKVNQGIWIDRNILRNKKEMALGIERCKTVKSIKVVTVGNEVLKSQFISCQKLIEYIKQAKDCIDLPISTAERPKFWLANPQLVKEVDFIALNIFPYWEAIKIDDAVAYIQQVIKQLAKKYPNKEIKIYDTGWSSAGLISKKAIPSLENEERYLREITAFCNRKKMQYYFFEAFDESWKRMAEGETGVHWGIYDKDRIAKF